MHNILQLSLARRTRMHDVVAGRTEKIYLEAKVLPRADAVLCSQSCRYLC